MGDGRRDDSERDILPWEAQPSEPRRAFRTFEIYRQMPHPRSLRRAHALATGEDPDRASSVPGALTRTAKRWRWQERVAAWDSHIAELDAALLEKARRAARARRIAMLDRAGDLIAKRLAAMKDFKAAPHRLIDAMVKTIDSEREELLDAREDRKSRGEDEPDRGLPAIEDVIEPEDPTRKEP
jgi:hypothetical protein